MSIAFVAILPIVQDTTKRPDIANTQPRDDWIAGLLLCSKKDISLLQMAGAQVTAVDKHQIFSTGQSIMRIRSL